MGDGECVEEMAPMASNPHSLARTQSMTNQTFDFEAITNDDLMIASGGRIRLQNLTVSPIEQLRRLRVRGAGHTAVAFLGPPEFAGVN